jgi:hypothetical protein
MAALKLERESGVIHPKAVKHGCVNVMDVDSILSDVIAEIVR